MSFSAAYFTQRHLLGIEGLSRPAILYLLDLALEAAGDIRAFGRTSRLAGRNVVGLFPDAPVGARDALVEAGRRLGAKVLFAPPPAQGATLSEIAAGIAALDPAITILRSPEAGVAKTLAGKLDCAVVNAGDGAHEDPIQALVDAQAIRRAKGEVDGLVVAICGDALHSGAARSNLILLTCLGARVRMVGPSALLPPRIGQMGVEVFRTMRDGLDDADVVMMLSGRGESADFPEREYVRFFGFAHEKLGFARPDAVVIHHGPIGCRDQDTAEVAVRMAVLEALAKNLPAID